MLDTEIRAADIDLSDPGFWALPRDRRYAAFDLLRRDAPVSWQKPPVAWSSPDYPPLPGYWAVTRHADVRTVGRDTRRFTTNHGVSPYDNRDGEDRLLIESWMVLDPPEVHKFRGIFAKAFAPRMIASLEGWVERAVTDAIARIADRGECDFFHDLTHDFPITVICDMLGIPQSDRAHFTHTMDVVFGGYGTTGSSRESTDAVRELNEYGSELARHRRRKPTDDLISALAHAEIDGQSLSDVDLGSSFFNIASGGMETTGTAAAHCLINLSRHPDERRRWQGNFDALAPTAIDELLRWAPVVISFRRVARVDTELSGQPIAAGDHVYMFFPAANFDPAVFADPYTFDLGRDPNPHVSFGFGPHFCIGNELARMELRTFFRELFRTLPDIDLAGEPVWAGHPFLDPVESLPCSYTPNPTAAAR